MSYDGLIKREKTRVVWDARKLFPHLKEEKGLLGAI